MSQTTSDAIPVETRTVATADGTIHVERGGSGPPLLALTGSGTTLEASAPMIQLLRRSFDTIALDHRGMGNSSCPEEPWTMADQAADCLAVLDDAGLDRVGLIGVSFGGMVALELAVTAPERISRLCLCCTSAGGEAGASFPLHLLALLPPDERVATSRLLLDRRFDDEWLAAHPFDRMIAERMGEASAGDERAASLGYRHQLAARAGHDVVDRLDRISCPTFVLAGRFDGIAPVANSEAMVSRIGDARLSVYDGGHVFFLQDRRAWPEVVEFLSG